MARLTGTSVASVRAEVPTADTTMAPASLTDRIGWWLSTRLPAVAWLGVPTRQLALARVPVHVYWGERAGYFLAGLFVPGFLAVLAAVAGVPVPVPIPVAGSLVLAVAASFIPNLTIQRNSGTVDTQLLRSVGAYLDLVAMERAAGSGTTAALHEAAGAGDNWVFHRIREELALASLTGSTAWDALDRLADEWGSTEMRDLSDIVRLSAEQGTSIVEALRARSASLRDAALAAAQGKANETTERMTIPITLLAFVFLLLLASPAVLSYVAFG